MVTMTEITEQHDADELKKLIANHVAETGSALGKKVLEHFDEFLPNFKKIIPEDYRKMMICIGKLEEKGIPYEQAKLKAFYLAETIK